LKKKREKNHLLRISVEGGFSLWHRLAITAVLITVIYGIVNNPLVTSTLIVVFFIFFTFLILTAKCFVALLSDRGVATPERLLKNEECPHFTVLLPAFREDEVLPQLIENIKRLDYPKDKLHVRLLLEERDQKTIEVEAFLRRRGLIPEYVKTLVVPLPQAVPSLGKMEKLKLLLTFPFRRRKVQGATDHPAPGPLGKPRALMYAVNEGWVFGSKHSGHIDPNALAVIYDAEDHPEPDQLRKAASIFATSKPNVVCLQATLMWHNATKTILTRMIAGQYAWTFAMMDPGLAATNGVVPLGGTSNHFKVSALDEVGYWDPSNVTEDLDLGVKLRRAGKRVAMLPSVTYEEAATGFWDQVKQASRWIKGHPATAISHTRNPFSLVRDLGVWGTITFVVVVLGSQPAVVAGPLFWLMTICYVFTGASVIQEITPAPAFYIGSVCLLANIYFVFMFMLACMKTGQYQLIPWMMLLPFYWATVSFLAGILATREIMTGNLYYWAKTTHKATAIKEAGQEILSHEEMDISSQRSAG